MVRTGCAPRKKPWATRASVRGHCGPPQPVATRLTVARSAAHQRGTEQRAEKLRIRRQPIARRVPAVSPQRHTSSGPPAVASTRHCGATCEPIGVFDRSSTCIAACERPMATIATAMRAAEPAPAQTIRLHPAACAWRGASHVLGAVYNQSSTSEAPVGSRGRLLSVENAGRSHLAMRTCGQDAVAVPWPGSACSMGPGRKLQPVCREGYEALKFPSNR